MRTASELLVEGGPAAVTIDAITARSGIAKTTIYRHWPTHEALIVALFRAARVCKPSVLIFANSI